jgi:hypothetical protein
VPTPITPRSAGPLAPELVVTQRPGARLADHPLTNLFDSEAPTQPASVVPNRAQRAARRAPGTEAPIRVLIREPNRLGQRQLRIGLGQRLAGVLSPLSEFWQQQLGWRGRADNNLVVGRALVLRGSLGLAFLGLLIAISTALGGSLVLRQPDFAPPTALSALAWNRGPVAFVPSAHDLVLADGGTISGTEVRQAREAFAGFVRVYTDAWQGQADPADLAPWITVEYLATLEPTIRDGRAAGVTLQFPARFADPAALQLITLTSNGGAVSLQAFISGPLVIRHTGNDGQTSEQAVSTIQIEFRRDSSGVWRVASLTSV